MDLLTLELEVRDSNTWKKAKKKLQNSRIMKMVRVQNLGRPNKVNTRQFKIQIRLRIRARIEKTIPEVLIKIKKNKYLNSWYNKGYKLIIGTGKFL